MNLLENYIASLMTFAKYKTTTMYVHILLSAAGLLCALMYAKAGH